MRAPNSIDHTIDDPNANSVPRYTHWGAREPAVIHGVVTVQRVGVHVAIRCVVPPTDGVEEAADHARCQATTGHLQIGQAQPGTSAWVKRLEVAERLAEIAACCVDELRHLRCAACHCLRRLV